MFKIINVAMPDQKNVFLIAGSAAYVAAVNPNSTKTQLAHGVSIFFINDKPVLINGPRELRNLSS